MVCGPTCVSLGKMASLTSELRLIAEALEQLRGHLEHLLAEANEMQMADAASHAHATPCARSVSPLADQDVEKRAEGDAVDAGPPRSDDTAAPAPDEEDFWAALRAAMAEAPALADSAEVNAGSAGDGMAGPLGQPTIDPADVRKGSQADHPAVGSAVAIPAHTVAFPTVAAAAAEMVGATPAPIYVIAYRQRRRQSERRWPRYAALVALIATIVVMALVSNGVTRGFADFLPRIDGEARPS